MRSTFIYKSVLCLWILGMGISPVVYADGETNDMDARALAMGNIKALSQTLLNPAYLPFKAQKELGAFVYNRFMMKELNTMSLFATVPNRMVDAGFLFSTYGYEDYRVIQGQASLAKKLSSCFAIGTNLIYLNENSILEPESKNYLSAGIGLYYRINKSLEAAFVTENLLRTNHLFPAVYNLGIFYRLLPNCNVLIETGFDFIEYLDIKTGIEYEIASQFTVRAGFKTQPKTPSIGFAYTVTQWKTEAAFLLHPVLGVSSAIGIVYSF